MTTENFAHWLSGYLASNDNKGLSPKQTKEVSERLDSVFLNVTSQMKANETKVINLPLTPNPAPSTGPGIYC